MSGLEGRVVSARRLGQGVARGACLQRKLIAVVDDDPDFRLALELLVQAAGYETTSFSNGASFLAALQTFRPAAAFLDLSMPHIDGLAVLSALKERAERIPVIVVTGSGRRDRLAARDRGAFAILEKPVDPQDLQDVLAAALGDDPIPPGQQRRPRRRP
jgi:FixJ family two-component response regulator